MKAVQYATAPEVIGAPAPVDRCDVFARSIPFAGLRCSADPNEVRMNHSARTIGAGRNTVAS